MSPRSSTSALSEVRLPKARLTGSRSVTRAGHGVGDDAGHRADEGEVAGLLAVAVDGQRHAAQCGVDEGRHDGGIRVAGRLERPVDVEEAEREHGQAVGVPEGHGVGLGGLLAHRVGRDGRGAHRLALGQLAVGPVDRRRRRDDDVEVAGAAGRLEHLERAGGVGVVGGHRVEHRPGDRGQGAEVHDGARALTRGVERGGVEDRSLEQADAGALEVGAAAGRQVVEGDDLVDVGAGEQLAAEVGADEAGAAGDDDLHVDPPCRGGGAPSRA